MSEWKATMRNARVSRRSEKLGASPWEGAPGTAYVEATTKKMLGSPWDPESAKKNNKKTQHYYQLEDILESTSLLEDEFVPRIECVLCKSNIYFGDRDDIYHG